MVRNSLFQQSYEYAYQVLRLNGGRLAAVYIVDGCRARDVTVLCSGAWLSFFLILFANTHHVSILEGKECKRYFAALETCVLYKSETMTTVGKRCFIILVMIPAVFEYTTWLAFRCIDTCCAKMDGICSLTKEN